MCQKGIEYQVILTQNSNLMIIQIKEIQIIPLIERTTIIIQIN